MAGVARDLEVRPDMLRRWKRQLDEDPVQAFPGKGNLKADEEEVRRLRRDLERAFLVVTKSPAEERQSRRPQPTAYDPRQSSPSRPRGKIDRRGPSGHFSK
jgi:transposase-like protein